MINDENHPKMVLATEQLFARIKHFTGRRFANGELHDLQKIVKDHRVACKLNGVNYPELVPMILHKQGGIDLVRKDLEPAGVRAALYNLIQKYPNAEPDELAHAVRTAFPHYRPSMFEDLGVASTG